MHCRIRPIDGAGLLPRIGFAAEWPSRSDATASIQYAVFRKIIIIILYFTCKIT